MTTEKLLDTIEWQGESIYTTVKGKHKLIRTGIPTSSFWHEWKFRKDAIKALKITVRKVGKVSTGEFRIIKGKSREIIRNQWEVIQWLGNAELAGNCEEPF